MSRPPARVNPGELQDVHWRKSSYSGPTGGNCVEMGTLAPAGIAVRDSRSPAGPALVFAVGAWEAFVGRCRSAVSC